VDILILQLVESERTPTNLNPASDGRWSSIEGPPGQDYFAIFSAAQAELQLTHRNLSPRNNFSINFLRTPMRKQSA
jgi:hypothetical protein